MTTKPKIKYEPLSPLAKQRLGRALAELTRNLRERTP